MKAKNEAPLIQGSTHTQLTLTLAALLQQPEGKGAGEDDLQGAFPS